MEILLKDVNVRFLFDFYKQNKKGVEEIRWKEGGINMFTKGNK